jgi:hypothetical protein
MPPNDNIAEIIKEMSGKTSERFERERQQADRSAKKEREAEERAAATRIASAALDEQQRRDETWVNKKLGRLSPGEFRQWVQNRYGYDPNV